MKNGLVHVTTHEGKMEGIPSISTDTTTNPLCLSLSSLPNSPCASCYARRLENCRPSLQSALSYNSDLLGCSMLPENDLPWFPPGWLVRFNSFGELLNFTHLTNLVRITEKNPDVHFALWTKNIELIDEAYELGILPRDNLVLIQSALMVQSRFEAPEEALLPYFDYLYIVTHDGEPCGDRCIKCRRCYSKPAEDATLEQRIVWQLKH